MSTVKSPIIVLVELDWSSYGVLVIIVTFHEIKKNILFPSKKP